MQALPLRHTVAVAVGRAAGLASRRLRLGGGTTIPGAVARRIDARVTRHLAARLAGGCVLVSGTNGKTTTSRLLAAMLRGAGYRVVHNRAGANLMAGVTTALLSQHGDSGLFEVDEAVLPAAIRELKPRLVLCLNLFRDQLDRYGELNTLASRWQQALATLPASATAVLNADDPLVASIGASLACRTVFFGLETVDHRQTDMQHAADSLYCPRCSGQLDFEAVYLGHLGHYCCPICGWRRPDPSFALTGIRLDPAGPTQLRLRAESHELAIEANLPGLYNAYNVLAAAAAALTLGAAGEQVSAAVGGFTAAFGRTETMRLDGRQLRLMLAKNPVGCNEVIRTLLLDPDPLNLYLVLNDRVADGEDVSWIWDVDFELLAGRCRTVILGGTRAEDLAVRLKYAGFPTSELPLEGNQEAAIRALLARTPDGGRAYAVPTYTAMLDLRRTLTDMGAAGQFWED